MLVFAEITMWFERPDNVAEFYYIRFVKSYDFAEISLILYSSMLPFC